MGYNSDAENRVYLHSFSRCWLLKLQNRAKFGRTAIAYNIALSIYAIYCRTLKHTRSQVVARIADRTASLPHSIFGVTWRHRSRDHLILHRTIGLCHSYWLVVLWNGVYLQPFSRYCALSVLGSRVWPFKVTWRHRLRDYLIAHMLFPIGGPLNWNQASISNGFRDIQRQM